MSKIVSEYAKALFMLATEKEKGKDYEEALDLANEVLLKNPLYMEILVSPNVPLKERLSLIENAFSNDLPRDVISFIKLLCEKGYIKVFSECVSYYKELLNEVSKVVNAKVTSAIELGEQRKKELKEKLEKVNGHFVEIEYAVDEKILGGLIVEMDGKVINSSLQKHLKDIKDVIGR